MTFCVALGCTSDSHKKSCKGLSFFSFPLKNKKLLEIWMAKLRRVKPVNKYSKVCSLHFKSDCLKRVPGGTKRNLKPGSYPTIFNYINSTPKRKSPEKQVEPIKAQTEKSTTCATIQESRFVLDNDVSSLIVIDAVDTETERQDELEAEIVRLKEMLRNERAIRTNLTDRLEAAEKRNQSLLLCIENVKDNVEFVRFYTGFDSYDTFTRCYKFVMPNSIEDLHHRGNDETRNTRETTCLSRSLTTENEFFLTVCKLRCNFCLDDIARRMEISKSQVNRIFRTWVHLMYNCFKQVPIWLPRNIIAKLCPSRIREKYPSIRCIIDCTEIPIECLSNSKARQLTCSGYENRNTMKALIACTPNGNVCFVSELCGGNVSDKELTERSKLLEKCEPGDMILTDRFDIEDLARKYNVDVNLPPVLNCKGQFIKTEPVETRGIVTHRIQIERLIERIRNYHFLDYIPNTQTDIANECFFVCVMLNNFQVQP